MVKLFLDDERNVRDVTWVRLPIGYDWDIVRNYKDFCEYFETHDMPSFVSFDHDLADFHYEVMLQEVNHFTAINEGEGGPLNLTFDYGPEKTGYDCAKWLVEYCIDKGIRFPGYVVHSLNPIGRQRIESYIDWAKSKIDTL